MELADLNKAGILFYDVHALVANKTIGTAKNGKEFANITLKAGSATVRGIKWSYNAAKYDELLTTGTIFFPDVNSSSNIVRLSLAYSFIRTSALATLTSSLVTIDKLNGEMP